jgi:hypothetical protein
VNILTKVFCALGKKFLCSFASTTKLWNRFVSILTKVFCVSGIFFFVVLHLLPRCGVDL